MLAASSLEHHPTLLRRRVIGTGRFSTQALTATFMETPTESDESNALISYFEISCEMSKDGHDFSHAALLPDCSGKH